MADAVSARRSAGESAVIGVALAVASPLLWVVALWWSAAAARQIGLPMSLGGIKAAAFTGLGIGIVLDALLLPHWVRGFYAAPLTMVLVVYLGLCVIAEAFCMGFPAGPFAVGIAAGVYIGRRARYAGHDRVRARGAIGRTTLLTAIVTTVLALPIGILALRDGQVLGWLSGHLGATPDAWSGPAGWLLVAGLLICLFALQYVATRWAGGVAHAGWRGR